ncbi:hypothetical protein Hanom_Chr06g00517701 [Helianthus anomalus]
MAALTQKRERDRRRERGRRQKERRRRSRRRQWRRGGGSVSTKFPWMSDDLHISFGYSSGGEVVIWGSARLNKSDLAQVNDSRFGSRLSSESEIGSYLVGQSK